MAIYTVDASVFVNAFQAHEEGHGASRGMLASMHEEAVPLIVPTLLFAEIAGTVARGCDDSDLGRGFADAVSRLPNLLPVPLDRRLARQAAGLAAEHRLRGSDAVYAAVASRFGSVLVTRDREQHRRLADLLATRRPEEVEL